MNKKELSDKLLKEIQKEHDNGVLWIDLIKKFGVSCSVLNKYVKLNKLTRNPYIKNKHSIESKKKISDARKKYLKENPDKHPWKINDKFKSKPCEKLKEKLIENNIVFIPEYTDSDWGRFYSIDIAFPKNKIAIEINGNQHYNRDGSLKNYYQEKHDIIEKNGWVIYEIHYSVIYNELLINSLIDNIKDSSLNQNDFNFYHDKFKKLKEERKNKYFCIDCGIEITKDSNSGKCVKCSNLSQRKVVRPSIDILLLDIKKLGYCGTGRKYGVSDAAIRKWVKK